MLIEIAQVKYKYILLASIVKADTAAVAIVVVVVVVVVVVAEVLIEVAVVAAEFQR